MGIAFRPHAQVERLVGTGFTEAQARAIAESVDAAAGEAVEALKQELARWHAFLALYVLMQIAVALLAILIAQAASPSARSLADASGAAGEVSTHVRDLVEPLIMDGDTRVQFAERLLWDPRSRSCRNKAASTREPATDLDGSLPPAAEPRTSAEAVQRRSRV